MFKRERVVTLHAGSKEYFYCHALVIICTAITLFENKWEE
jgi:hypothetical protein